MKTLLSLSLLAVLAASCGGGGGGSSPPPVSTPTVSYPNSILLGSTAVVSLSLMAATTTANASLISPVAAPFVVSGSNSLVSLYTPAGYAGAGIACVSAPTNSIGTITNVNAGVNIKSVAVLLNGTWSAVPNPSASWSGFGANAKVFDGWENCGAKAEGSPSPASTLTVNADGSFSDNVFDGNPSTTVRIVDQAFSASQANAMLSSTGLLDTSQPTSPQIIRMTIYQNAANQAMLVEQAIPTAGASSDHPGYVAIYFAR